jgi:hypothetical protein
LQTLRSQASEQQRSPLLSKRQQQPGQSIQKPRGPIDIEAGK